MRGKILSAMGALTTVLAAPVSAQDGTNQFAVETFGRVNCTEFMSVRKNRASVEYARIMGFVSGYLTAANRYEPDTFDLSPWHNSVAFDLIIEKHCAEHGTDTLVGTLQRMVSSFRPIRVAKYSDLVRVGDGQGSAILYQTILQRAQTYLKAGGLFAGEPDGRDSPQFREAIRAFQQGKGLTATGIPDPATLWTLLNP